MKNILILLVLILTLSQFGQAQNKGLLQSAMNTQSDTAEKVKQLLLQSDSERNSGVKTPSKNYAVFRPSPSENLKNIANEMGKTAEEKAMFLQVFTETKKGFESQAANGMKNNIAAAMTFLMTAAVTVYHQSPEPSDAATNKIFRGFNTMFDEMPEMANISDKDKQFLYDLYISYGGLILAANLEAQESKNKNSIDTARVLAGSVLLDLLKINPTTIYFEGDSLRMKSESGKNETRQTQPVQPTSRTHAFAKQTTTFSDGWTANVTDDYVRLTRNDAEIRLFYVNSDWEKGYSNMVQQNDYYWQKAVAPYFNVSNVQTWSGVEYPIIYFRQADAIDKKTGKRCFISMKIVFQGGANVIVAVYPNRAAYEKEFKHPNNLDPMLNANRFAVTAKDLIGTWASGTGGAGWDYYNMSGSWVGMMALSDDDEFIFNSNGNYQHTYKSANVSSGGSRFARIDYKGKFSVSDWEMTATNHYQGTTAKFSAQIVAVRGGYLLVLTNQRNNITYRLFQKR